MPYKEGPVHNKTEEGEGRRTRSGGVPPNRVEIRAGVIQTRGGGAEPPHPSIIRNPIKEFCEQMAISHRETEVG